MKRLFALMCVLVFILSACGQSEGQTIIESGVMQTDSLENNLELETQAVVEMESDASEISFEEVIAVDNEYCTIKITEIDLDNMWGYTLKTYLENKSDDKVFMYSVDSAAINGVDTDPYFATEVAAGKKSNEEITFMSDELEKEGITDYTDIELNFRVYDSNDWTAEDVVQISVHVYPYGEENAVRYTREQQDSDVILVDNEYTKVVVTGYEWDEIWGYNVMLYIENKSDTSIMVSADNVSVNGFMLDPFYADSVSAGNCAFSSMSWYEEDLEANGITEIEEIEFVLKVYDDSNWAASDFFNQTVTLNP